MITFCPQATGRANPGLTNLAITALLAGLLLTGACRQSIQSPSESQQGQVRSKPDSSPKVVAVRVRSNIGFATERKLLDHYDKHGEEFGAISREEYLRQAQELRDRPAGGDVLEITREDGVSTRFDRKTGAFLAFNRDLTIRTYFKPNDGEAYFRRQSKRGGRPAGRDDDD